MKKNALIFSVCAAFLGICGVAVADDADTARAATRRTSGPATPATTTTRQKSATTTTATSRGGAGAKSISARTTTTRDGTVISDKSRRADTTTARTGATVTARTATVQPRITQPATSARTATNTAQRTTGARTATSAARVAITPARSAARANTIARSGTINQSLRDEILGRDYKSCRTVFYECMDEFCANKDSQLKRCACSSRIHEFDRVKKQLSNAEDKMLEFNQRLLTVNMDKEDAAALFTATEGELAFNSTKDTSDSKKILDEISKKLKTDSTDSSFNQNLSAISLSLNMDSAFDSVDSLMGVDTSSKEGVALYNAALPVCREMAAEVCDEDSLNLAITGYQMAIEQDCTTVSKSYSSQVDQARDKIREGGALLDMSRLDIYQKRNSDDILTCKKKMLAQLSDTSVCGENLGRCLDMTGRYIDPTTGQAFLTDSLGNLANLIVRPDGNQSWTTAPGNAAFAQYLQSKKKYLEPAMENCQDIADNVWDAFIEDALAQIKLAQESKLEEVRQSCTTLTTQCLSDTAKSLEDFDARALSTFGVAADKTVNAMCASVKNACTALLETTGGDTDWVGGMTQIATEKTYDTIIQTCREVGRACIIQACKSVSGNFGLCESMETSINRKSIINRTSCWPEVLSCVRSAGADSINKIFETSGNSGIFGFSTTSGDFYNNLYNLNQAADQETCYTLPATSIGDDKNKPYQCIHDICSDICNGVNITESQEETTNEQTLECRVCRIAESIWGNCEAAPASPIEAQGSHNQILMTKSQDNKSLISTDNQTRTLLSWFAINTGTQNDAGSCRDTSCPAGYKLDEENLTCIDINNFTPYCNSPSGKRCPTDEQSKIIIKDSLKNCCETKQKLNGGATCCTTKILIKGYTPNNTFYQPLGTTQSSISGNICDAPNAAPATKYQTILQDGDKTLVCLGEITAADENATYPGGQTLKCSGRWIYVTQNGEYIDAKTGDKYMYYWDAKGTLTTPPDTTNINGWLIGNPVTAAGDHCGPQPSE